MNEHLNGEGNARVPRAPRRRRVRARTLGLVLGIGCLVMCPAGIPASAQQQPASPDAKPGGDDRAWVLSTTDTSKNYAPTFVGNGYLAARVPAAGHGYGSTPITTQAQLAGFYGAPRANVEDRASLPMWTTLGFGRSGESSGIYGVAPATAGARSNYRQSLDLRTGVLTTSFDWTSPAGDKTSFTYEVNANRAEGHLATVTLRAVPHWNGTATTVDKFDGQSLNHASTTAKHVDGTSATMSATVETDGKLATAGLNSVLRVDGRTKPTTEVTDAGKGSAGQTAAFEVVGGKSYEITKYVGIASSGDTDRPLTASPQEAAALTASTAAKSGYAAVLKQNAAAWTELWKSRISIPGDAEMNGLINASMFYLLASTRAGVDWSITPGGLSSNDYYGHVFWDTETWMYPALLAQYPDIANGANTYRQKLLPAAEAEAKRLSTPQQPIKGAKFPWQSALTGKETTPSWSTDGKQEIHINSDIALAQWQYFQATGDTNWLRDKAWPVLEAIADYWATWAVRDGSGVYHIKGVTGPDEHHNNVNDSVTTNAGAQASLRIAIDAARILKLPAPEQWSTVANGLTIPVDAKKNIHPEFEGYAGQTIKQADVTLLQYPWNVPMSPSMAQNDLDYYNARTDTFGPSMTDAIAAIASAKLGSPGCTTYSYLKNSVTPFLSAPFHQWHEGRGGGAFNFTTGQGGYLQEFLYGFTGLRWETDAVTIDPFLPTPLPGVDITGVKWHGSRFDISVGQDTTTLTLREGSAVAVRDRNGTTHQLRAGTPLQFKTRHPAATPKPAGCTGPITSPSTGKCVDIRWGNGNDGTPIQHYECNGGGAQKWARPGDGTLRALDKCMDVRWGTSNDGTPVQLYKCNDSAAQQWSYDEKTSELKALGKCLERAGRGTTNGTPLVINTCNGGLSQKWHLPS